MQRAALVLVLVVTGAAACASSGAVTPTVAAVKTTTTTAPAFINGTVVRSRRTTTTLAAKPVPLPSGRNWTWDMLAECESRLRWGAVRGIYQGGLQFDERTWDHYAPAGFPADAQAATREQQIAVGELVFAREGVRSWPTCGPRIGMTGGPNGPPELPAAGPPDDAPD